MSRLGNHTTRSDDVVSLHRIVREWGSDDPEGKEQAREDLHAAQSRQGVPNVGIPYVPWAEVLAAQAQAQI